ncbi:MAG: hypothetical protein M0T84_04365 [Betaproteobacteria bacterium]|nr:hypothetical protein [Betaproteobacteria bacterium]
MQDVLTRSLTEREIRKQMEAAGQVEGTVAVDLEEIIDADRDTFLTLLSELLTDSPDLDDIEYEVLGVDDGMLQIHVTADASALLEELADEGEDEEDE